RTHSLALSLLLSRSRPPPALHSFPTRRSSDLLPVDTCHQAVALVRLMGDDPHRVGPSVWYGSAEAARVHADADEHCPGGAAHGVLHGQPLGHDSPCAFSRLIS